ncbi:MAG: mechanosensitive ion channel domain-containing protein [Bacteroidota bacterium]
MSENVRKLLTMILCIMICVIKLHGQDTTGTSKVRIVKDKLPLYLDNPAIWMSECYDHLNSLYLFQTGHSFDTTRLFDNFREHLVTIAIMKKNFYGKSGSLNIRTVDNMQMRVAHILEEITQWQQKIHHENELGVEKAKEILRIKNEIKQFDEKADSAFLVTYAEGITRLSTWQRTGETVILQTLKRNTAIENKIIGIKTEIYLFHTDLLKLLKNKETELITRELPPVWASSPAAYPFSIWNVLSASFMQTLESLKYYGELSLWRIVIFRGLIVLLCLVPIKIFNDEKRKKKILDGTRLTFLAEFPKSASVVMGMAVAPFVFIHPPHAFMEFLLVGLTFTVTMLTLKQYPRINKLLLTVVITSFLVLYLINFFVTPTFIGRLIYTSSILLLIPLYMIYKQMPSYQLAYTKTTRVMIIFLAVHLVTGWLFVILGYYTLGRSIILSGYNLLIISMILRIAIFTLLDYIEIIAHFFNKSVTRVKIDSRYVCDNTKPLLIFFAFIFNIVAYLYNMNIFDLVNSGIDQFMTTPRSIGTTTFTFMSIFLFFVSVYLAFILASLIRNTFLPQHEQTVKQRSGLGSYLLLLRLLILCTGFVVGILASGLALTNFAIFLGAMGVGIGFGLQNLVSNLISGLIIAFERPFVVGDVLDFNNETCKVKEISLRATMVSNSEGADILIPNNTLLSANLKNWTISNKQRLVELKVQTTIEANPAQVMEIIDQCLGLIPNVIKDRSLILFSDINDTGMVFTIKILVKDLSNSSSTKSQLLAAIHGAFFNKGIRFPQRIYTIEDQPG